MFRRIGKYSLLVIAALMIIALVVTAAVAVPGGPRAGAAKMCRGGQCAQQVAEKLGLTEAQKTQIKGIFENYRGRIKQIKQANLTQDAKRAEVQSLRKDMRNAIEQVLTPEQREKAKQMRADARRQMKERRAERMKALGLTTEQLAKIKSIREAGREKVKAIRTDTGLTDQERMGRIKAIRKETREQVMSVLTPEQREKIRQMHPKMGQGRVQQGAACKLAK